MEGRLATRRDGLGDEGIRSMPSRRQSTTSACRCDCTERRGSRSKIRSRQGARSLPVATPCPLGQCRPCPERPRNVTAAARQNVRPEEQQRAEDQKARHTAMNNSAFFLPLECRDWQSPHSCRQCQEDSSEHTGRDSNGEVVVQT